MRCPSIFYPSPWPAASIAGAFSTVRSVPLPRFLLGQAVGAAPASPGRRHSLRHRAGGGRADRVSAHGLVRAPRRLVRRATTQVFTYSLPAGSSRRLAYRSAPSVNHPLTIVAQSLVQLETDLASQRRDHCAMKRAQLLGVAIAGVCGLGRLFRRHEPRQHASPPSSGRKCKPTPRRCWWPRTKSASARSPAPENFRWQDWPQNAVSPQYIQRSARPERDQRFDGAVARAPMLPGEPVTAAEAREGRRRAACWPRSCRPACAPSRRASRRRRRRAA